MNVNMEMQKVKDSAKSAGISIVTSSAAGRAVPLLSALLKPVPEG